MSNNNSPFDWNSFKQQFMGNNFPGTTPNLDNLDFSWIEKYVQNVIESSIPDTRTGNSPNKSRALQPEMFETHDYIIIRMFISEDILQNIQILLDSNNLLISGLRESKQEMIKLPSNGKASGSKAVFHDDVLEVRILKDRSRSFKEIPIEYK